MSISGNLCPECMSIVHLHLYVRFRHRNLVDLMGFCRKPQAIVYEYMEQGSLFQHLHIKVTCSVVVAYIAAAYFLANL